LDSTYFDPRPRIYDGNHYSLGFTDSVKHNIQFIQNDSPPFLRELSIKLDSVIFKSTTQIDSFNLEKYKNYLKEKSIAVFGEIPTPKRSKPPKINTIKFE
jgi:hypothetical protein